MLSLPEETQLDIFLRLPVESILSCKYLCKPFHDLISSPEFIKLHLTQNKNNQHLVTLRTTWEPDKEPSLWSVDLGSVTSSSSGALKCNDAVPMYSPFRYVEQGEINILDSCNGLICLGICTPLASVSLSGTPKDTIYLWNPATREYKDIPLPSSSSKSKRFGLGYDCKIENYKLVHIYNPGSYRISSQIYTLGSDLWRPISGELLGFYLDAASQGLHLNGALHWVAHNLIDTIGIIYKRTIIGFNFSDERLIDLPFPEETLKCSIVEVGILENCLCLVSSDSTRTGSCFDVWVMLKYGVVESWTKQFSFSSDIPSYYTLKPLRSLQNGQILMHARGSLISCDQNGSIQRLELFPKKAGSEKISVSLKDFVYAESLVSLNSGTYMGRGKRIATTKTYTMLD